MPAAVGLGHAARDNNEQAEDHHAEEHGDKLDQLGNVCVRGSKKEIAGEARALATYTSLRYIDSDNDKTHMIQVGRSQACTRTALELDQQ